MRQQENIQVRSRQIYHEDVKFYTIDNGMCVGQCEGSTLYEVAVDEPCADRACHQTLQIPPEYDGTVVGLHKNKKDLDLECKSATAAVDADGHSPGLAPSIFMQTRIRVVDAVSKTLPIQAASTQPYVHELFSFFVSWVMHGGLNAFLTEI